MIKKKDRELTTAEKMKASRRPTWMVLILIAIVYIFLYRGFYGNGEAGESADTGKTELALSSESVSTKDRQQLSAVSASSDTASSESVLYEFRNKDRFLSHFEKHGEEVGCKTAEEYLSHANEVINDPGALHKNEAEDGDDIYFREDTGEIVFVSTDGYIRTYFIATKSYYDRQ